MARLEHRVEAAQTLVVACPRERDRRPRLDDVAGEPAAGRAPRAERGLRALAIRRGDDELVAVEQAERSGLGVHERRRLLHDLVEDRRRIELAREQPARPRQLLRERAGALRSASNSSLRSSAPRVASAR